MDLHYNFFTKADDLLFPLFKKADKDNSNYIEADEISVLIKLF